MCAQTRPYFRPTWPLFCSLAVSLVKLCWCTVAIRAVGPQARQVAETTAALRSIWGQTQASRRMGGGVGMKEGVLQRSLFQLQRHRPQPQPQPRLRAQRLQMQCSSSSAVRACTEAPLSTCPATAGLQLFGTPRVVDFQFGPCTQLILKWRISRCLCH